MTQDLSVTILTSLAFLLASGIAVSILSRKLKISNFLLLLFVGIGWQFFRDSLVGITNEFIITVSTLALIITVFEGASHLNIKRITNYTVKILNSILLIILLNMLILPFVILFLFEKQISSINMIVASLFGIIIIATDPTTIFNITKQKSNKTVNFLEIESILNTPLVVVIPIILLNIINENQLLLNASEILSTNLEHFMLQIAAGIGTGMIFGFFVFRSMRRFYSKNISPLALVTASLLGYVIAEKIGGNGIIALATMGIFFGNVKILKKENLEDFNSMLTGSLIILVFVFVGFLIDLNIFDYAFFIKSSVLFLIALLIRISGIFISLRKDSFTFKEKIFIGLNMPKGIAAAVVILSLSFFNLSFVNSNLYQLVLQLCTICIIYSLIVSTIVCKYEKYFLSKPEVLNETENLKAKDVKLTIIKKNKIKNGKKQPGKKKKI